MNKSFTVVLIAALLFSGLILFVGIAHSEVTLQPIYIKSNGAIEPTNAPIQHNGEVYTFTGDICGTIVIEKSGITIDGAGHTLYGTYNGTRTDTWVVGDGPNQELSNGTLWTIGIDFSAAFRPDNVTVKNLNIKAFYIGMYMWTSGNILIKSSVTENIVGVLLSGDSNTITENHIAYNDEGVFFGVNNPGEEPLNIVLTYNSFVNNKVQFSGCFCETYNTEELAHTWDDGSKGNYWSDYNGTDTNDDGVGDTPYIIDILNQDRYPLMQPLATSPTLTKPKTNLELFAISTSLAVISAATIIIYFKKFKKNQPTK